jgi:hypothetical protein
MSQSDHKVVFYNQLSSCSTMQLLQTFFRTASGCERIILSYIHDFAMSNSDSQNYKQKVYRNTILNLVSYSWEDLCYQMLVLSFI